jgi:LysM repeat protein
MKKVMQFVIIGFILCLPAVCSAAVPTEAEKLSLTVPTSYVVNLGDNLWKISQQVYHSGKYWTKIFYANNLPKSISGYPVIVAGEKLIVPALTANEVMSAVYSYSGNGNVSADASSTVAESSSTSSVENVANSSTDNSTVNQITSNGDHFLYRIIKDCATGNPTGKDYSDLTEFSTNQWALGYLQIVDLDKTGYNNYTCTNRYHEQCVEDGTADTYYEEWCTPGTKIADSISENNNADASQSSFSATEPKLSSADSLAGQITAYIPNGAELLTKKTTISIDDTKGLILFRIIRDCATGAGIIDQNDSVLTSFGPGRWEIHTLQEVFLDSADYYNYTCQSRFQEQCIDDGSFDSYYDELCVRQ